MLDVGKTGEGVAVYGLDWIIAEYDDADVRATGKCVGLDVGYLVVREDDAADVLQSREGKLADVRQGSVLNGQREELVETAKGERPDLVDDVAVEVELFQMPEV